MDLLIILTYVAFAWVIFKNIPYSGKPVDACHRDIRRGVYCCRTYSVNEL